VPDLQVTEDHDELLTLTYRAIHWGTKHLKKELHRLYHLAWMNATEEERDYLKIIKNRIIYGSLAEQIADRYTREGDLNAILTDLEQALKGNYSYVWLSVLSYKQG
jgi:hypothetical protein